MDFLQSLESIRSASTERTDKQLDCDSFGCLHEVHVRMARVTPPTGCQYVGTGKVFHATRLHLHCVMSDVADNALLGVVRLEVVEKPLDTLLFRVGHIQAAQTEAFCGRNQAQC